MMSLGTIFAIGLVVAMAVYLAPYIIGLIVIIIGCIGMFIVGGIEYIYNKIRGRV